jgi:hypothetical protein
MPASEALSAHIRRDTRLASLYATLGTSQAVLGTAAVIVSIFIAPHNLIGLVLLPLALASLLTIGSRRHRPTYRTRSWRLRPELRDGNIHRHDALRIMADDVGATSNLRWCALHIVGLAQGAAAALTVYLSGGPVEIAVAVAALWLATTANVVKIEIMLYTSAVHTLSLLDERPTPCRCCPPRNDATPN